MNEFILLKRRAKSQLTNQWLDAIAASLIYLVFVMLINYIGIGQFILYGSLTFGYVLYISCLVDRHISNLNLLFQGFKRFLDTMVAGLLYSLGIGVGLILLIVPGIILSCGLSMTFYIMSDDPNISGVDALKKSWEMMKGHKWEYFCLQLYFFWWMLLALITAGIAYIWLLPYMTATNLNYYRKLKYGTF